MVRYISHKNILNDLVWDKIIKKYGNNYYYSPEISYILYKYKRNKGHDHIFWKEKAKKYLFKWSSLDEDMKNKYRTISKKNQIQFYIESVGEINFYEKKNGNCNPLKGIFEKLEEGMKKAYISVEISNNTSHLLEYHDDNIIFNTSDKDTSNDNIYDINIKKNNIEKRFITFRIPRIFNALILDVDNAYLLWENLNTFRANIVFVKVNNCIPNDIPIFSNSDLSNNDKICRNANLLAFLILAEKKKYNFVTTVGNFAVFVKKNAVKDIKIIDYNYKKIINKYFIPDIYSYLISSRENTKWNVLNYQDIPNKYNKYIILTKKDDDDVCKDVIYDILENINYNKEIIKEELVWI
tara:strand:- start:1566 stop:2621 length:1056 start_codon:yes stop_codon:yes gene_type:complete